MTIRILLVDDHRMMRDGLRSVLASDPEIEVIGEAADGRAAIELAKTLRPELVVMDLGMREMNGIEATRRIKAESSDVRVIALSTHTDGRSVQRALEAGADAYVAKVSAFDELRRAVKTVVAGGSHLSPEIGGVALSGPRQQPLADGRAAHSRLGSREREVLQLVAEGLTSGEIAQRLTLSARTVDTHRRNIMRKLGLHSVAELTKFAITEGMTTLES